jgi:hypothetical protein
VLPAICTEEVITLGAELEDGTVIRGQNNISHPNEHSSSSSSGELDTQLHHLLLFVNIAQQQQQQQPWC